LRGGWKDGGWGRFSPCSVQGKKNRPGSLRGGVRVVIFKGIRGFDGPCRKKKSRVAQAERMATNHSRGGTSVPPPRGESGRGLLELRRTGSICASAKARRGKPHRLVGKQKKEKKTVDFGALPRGGDERFAPGERDFHGGDRVQGLLRPRSGSTKGHLYRSPLFFS